MAKFKIKNLIFNLVVSHCLQLDRMLVGGNPLEGEIKRLYCGDKEKGSCSSGNSPTAAASALKSKGVHTDVGRFCVCITVHFLRGSIFCVAVHSSSNSTTAAARAGKGKHACRRQDVLCQRVAQALRSRLRRGTQLTACFFTAVLSSL